MGGRLVTEGRLDPAVAAALASCAPGARMVSICTGAFVLAAAGRLDGRPATTHWLRTEVFRRFFPAVRLDPDVLYVDDGDVLTSAGNAAGIDLLLHLVRRDHGAEVANRVARRNVVAPWRDGRPVPVQCDRRLPDDAGPGTAATRAFALDRLDEPLPPRPDRRARGDERAHVHPPLPRRDRAEPAHLARRQRVARARRLLETTDLPVDRVAADAGFGTAASLRQHLRTAIGVSPGTYRRMYRGPR